MSKMGVVKCQCQEISTGEKALTLTLAPASVTRAAETTQKRYPIVDVS